MSIHVSVWSEIIKQKLIKLEESNLTDRKIIFIALFDTCITTVHFFHLVHQLLLLSVCVCLIEGGVHGCRWAAVCSCGQLWKGNPSLSLKWLSPLICCKLIKLTPPLPPPLIPSLSRSSASDTGSLSLQHINMSSCPPPIVPITRCLGPLGGPWKRLCPFVCVPEKVGED